MTDGTNIAAAAGVGQGKIVALGAGAVCALLIVAVALVASVGTVGAAGEARVAVWFVQGEQLKPVTRPGATPLAAVRQLIAGPTRAERHRGFRTYVPAATRVRSVSVANGLATVDLSEPFATGTTPESM